MDSEIVSGLIGALLGAGASFLSLRFNYKDLYARSVSSNRMEWINNFREEVSIIVAVLRSPTSERIERKQCHKVCSDTTEMIFHAEKARAKLLTRLNMDTSKIGNEYNKVMVNLLGSLTFNEISPESEHQADALIDLSRKILEPEWKRVKKEAGGDYK